MPIRHFTITGGVKQGETYDSLKIGCRIGPYNLSIIAYCDDIVFLSLTRFHLELVLDKWSEFGIQ
ncbi:hypothetical protein BpHYR1_027560 [Brachionus plicatilis]|uniref:Uncharacterized protein n=1 Tax=Brachionus plicatilis TaxID=10195 RepID=A0A3M7SNM5_BRAPC|nr:hypothetical protein BpHYR1_027560 [Brachionus plicatilis]